MLTNHRQQGVALITAMVITAIAVTVAATLVYRQQLAIRLAGNLAALEQAFQYASGMEDWAGIILTNDHKENDTDSKEDSWALLLPAIPIPGGQMNGQLLDLQSRLNINDLIIRKQKGGQTVDELNEIQIQRLERLIYRQGLLDAAPLINAALDWIDRDDQERIGGAESGYYKNLQFPYLTANSALTSPTELRLIKGFNERLVQDDGSAVVILDKLINHITVLHGQQVKINVNTADEEVLYSLGLDDTQVMNVITDREEEPFPGLPDFVNSLGLQNPDDFQVDDLDVRSNFFLLQGMVEIGKVRLKINSVIYRDNSGRTRILRREFLNL